MTRVLALIIPALLLVQLPVFQKHVSVSEMCAGAQVAVIKGAVTQERHTPDGEWCQRPTNPMPRKAHACKCHKHDCGDPDPHHLSAHTDPHCLNFCTVANCRCSEQDCS